MPSQSFTDELGSLIAQYGFDSVLYGQAYVINGNEFHEMARLALATQFDAITSRLQEIEKELTELREYKATEEFLKEPPSISVIPDGEFMPIPIEYEQQWVPKTPYSRQYAEWCAYSEEADRNRAAAEKKELEELRGMKATLVGWADRNEPTPQPSSYPPVTFRLRVPEGCEDIPAYIKQRGDDARRYLATKVAETFAERANGDPEAGLIGIWNSYAPIRRAEIAEQVAAVREAQTSALPCSNTEYDGEEGG